MKSPVLQACFNAMAKEKSPASGLHIVNVVLSNNAYGFPQDVAPLAQPQAALTSLMLLNYIEGPEMDIEKFCMIYNLPPTILTHFHKSAITGMHTFSKINSTNLK